MAVYEETELTKRIRAIQLEMVQRVLDVCNHHNLRIWADAGSLLGAVRHKGFIPWDDDIDLMMMRDDYDKLLRLDTSEFSDRFFLQSYRTERNYPHGHAQLRCNDTAAVRLPTLHINMHHGIFIDIFVYDAIPEARQEYSELQKKIKRTQAYLWLNAYVRPNAHSPILTCKHFISKFFHMQGFRGTQMLFEACEAELRKHSITDNEEIAPLEWNWRVTERYRRSKHCYDETLWVDFEDIKMPIPVQYDKVLTQMYGDYMTPQKVPTMHGKILFDPDTSYAIYVDTLRKDPSRFEELCT